MRSQQKVVQSLYMPPLVQLNQITSKHQSDMQIIEERFDECRQIHDRVEKLNERVQKSSETIGRLSEREKKLAVFLVNLNNKLYAQKLDREDAVQIVDQ